MGNRVSSVFVGNDRVLLRTASGLKMYVDSRDVSLAPHLILDGVWEEGTEAALRQLLKPDMDVVEVGANVGYFTLTMARVVGPQGSVTAFEPDPVLARIARDNAEINGYQDRVTVRESAVADAEGEVRFFATQRHRGNGSILEGFEQLPDNPEDRRVEIVVPAVTLDAAFSDKPPDAIKIDAEGAESAVLRGASRVLESSRLKILVLEFFPRFVRAAGDDPRSFLERLTARRFKLNRIDLRKRKIQPTTLDALLGMESAELALLRGEA